MNQISQQDPDVYTYIRQPLRRYTFESNGIKVWVQWHCCGKKVLNLFAGPTRLDNCNEVTNDLDALLKTTYHMDALDCVKMLAKEGETFDVVLLDPPYSYRKSMEMYHGNQNSRFKQILDVIPKILTAKGKVITFGYHSRVLSGKRGFYTRELCIISHGGAQHDTLVAVEERINEPLTFVPKKAEE